MEYDNNFGSNPAPGWELTPDHLAALAADLRQGGADDAGFDDLFDEPVYRAAQTTFCARGHRMMPHGQTHYRPAVTHAQQGIPEDRDTAHWGWIPARDPRPISRAAYAGGRLAHTLARDSGIPGGLGASDSAVTRWAPSREPAPWMGPAAPAAYDAPAGRGSVAPWRPQPVRIYAFSG